MQRGKDCRPGDKVRFLHEKGEGLVTKLTHEFVYVDIGEGFEIPMLHNDVIIMERAQPELPSSEVTAPIIQSSPKEKLRKSADIPKGIYIAFAPLNQKVLLTGDVKVYLMNYSKLGLMYTLFLTRDKTMSPSYTGSVEPASAVLIDTVDRQELSRFSRGVFQTIFTGMMPGGIPAPYSTRMEIKEGKFLKEDMYMSNPLIGMNALTSLLVRMDELNLIPLNADDSFFRKESGQGHSRMIEDFGFIGKFKTGPGEAEVDLHIDKLIDNIEAVSDAGKLKLQLDFCKQCIESAIEHSYKKVVFIHGVGVGILKMEIHKLLKQYDDLEYRDAPIAKYGIGATEVLLFSK
jgi:hypothetical protein